MKIIIKFKNSKAQRICENVDDVYDCVMALTNNNHDIASDVQGWSDLAYKGEGYEGENFTATCI